MTMSSKTRVEMGLMAGVLATVVMTIAIIVATSISSALGYPWQIQWYTWIGSIFGAQGMSGSVAEVGVAWFIALSIVAGLIFAFAFREHSVFEGLAVGLVAWFLVLVYLAFYTAPQLTGTLQTMSFTVTVELLIPLAVFFGLWGLAMGLVGKRYVG
jgi:hypothetical protein